MIHLILPMQLCTLASVGREIELEIEGTASLSTVLDTLEAMHPELRGTIRDQVTLQRRPFIRFFAGGEDLSLEAPTKPLPEEVASGELPLRVVGAMAGG
jgi:molybdopterin synthase sulfur carrier subunit